MRFCYNKLRGKIVEVYGSQAKFAEAIGISENTLSLKLNNRLEFTSEEIANAIKLLSIKTNEVYDVFFTQESEK